MSLPVNRDMRRAEVAQAGYEIVAERGLEALTVRNVAKAKGCSTAVVSHYFTDKRDLLVAVYDLAADLTFARWDAAEKAEGDLCSCLKSVLPIEPDMRRHWRVHFSFWSAAAIDPALAAIQTRVLRRSEQNVRRLISRELAYPEDDQVSQDQLCRQILSLHMGIATQASFGEQYWPSAQQISDLETAISALLGR